MVISLQRGANNLHTTGNQWNHVLLTWQKKTKICLALSLLLGRGWRSESARISPLQCAQSAPELVEL